MRNRNSNTINQVAFYMLRKRVRKIKVKARARLSLIRVEGSMGRGILTLATSGGVPEQVGQ